MSFIDKFLDLTATLPREIIRNLKLLKEVEIRSKENNTSLQKEREKFLSQIKDNKNPSSNESTIHNINTKYKELLTLSNYKKEIIKQIQSILEDNFLSNLEPIIQEGQKECQEQLSNPNYPYNENSLSNINLEKNNLDEYSRSSDYSKRRKENSNAANKNLLGNKKNRSKSMKTKKLGAVGEYNEDIGNVLHANEQASTERFCICHQPSYGNMIQCENPECNKGKWFHYACVGIDNEKAEILKKEWYCSEECKQNARRLKEKNSKKKKNFN